MDLLTAEEWTALTLSLRIAFWATVASLVPGILVALVLARGRFPGHGLLNAVVHLPLVLPPVVTGWLLLVSFGRRGPAGQALEACCGIVLSFRWTGAALAAAVMAFPLLVRAVRLSIEAVDRGLEDAAGTLGASPAWVFLTVTLPLAWPGVLAGAVLAFAKALGEFGATITFVSSIPGETQTLAAAIYGYTQVPGGDGPALRLVIIAVVVSMAALVASEMLARRMRARRP
ncbi:MAG: molybdate ABC transporter permease subunit [Alsobacter sp.]